MCPCERDVRARALHTDTPQHCSYMYLILVWRHKPQRERNQVNVSSIRPFIHLSSQPSKMLKSHRQWRSTRSDEIHSRTTSFAATANVAARWLADSGSDTAVNSHPPIYGRDEPRENENENQKRCCAPTAYVSELACVSVRVIVGKERYPYTDKIA